jgi:hypothetical protein
MLVSIAARVESARVMRGGYAEVWSGAEESGIPVCALWRHDGRFRMTGITGNHSVAVEATDLERLAAHWQGFRESNLRRAAGVARLMPRVSA